MAGSVVVLGMMYIILTVVCVPGVSQDPKLIKIYVYQYVSI